MRHTDTRHGLILVAASAAIVMIGLWSWNTLATLFGLPAAEVRHALAALALLLLLRGLLRPAGRRWPRRGAAPGKST